MIKIKNLGKPLFGKNYSIKNPMLEQWRAIRNKKYPDAWNEFDEKIVSGVYRSEQVPCICCGSSKFLLLSELDKHNIHISYVICTECGLVQLNPRYDQDSYNDWYKNLYMNLWEGLSEIKDPPQADHFAKNQFHLIEKMLVPGDKILEVGCNLGVVQKFLVQQGFDVYGCDYHEKAVEYAKRLVPEATIKKGGIDSFAGHKSTFKLIYMNHVLEHIVNPKQFIGRMREMLSPGGYLLIEVPGLKNWISNVKKNNIKTTIQFSHIYYFTEKIFQYIFEANGFEAIYIDNTITGVFQKKALYHEENNQKPPKEFSSNLFFLLLVRFFEIVIPQKIRKYIRYAN